MSELSTSTLTDAQKSRIERNRAKALSLRQAKLLPYTKNGAGTTDSIIKVKGTKYVDSGGGFLLEEEMVKTTNDNTISSEGASDKLESNALPIPIILEDCLECGNNFVDSFLYDNFGYSVCDKCRDPDGKHSLITRTEAKAEYLLKDCDFEKREPILRYISRKNPHNNRWGEMKLYLHLQVQERAMEVWGTEEELIKQHENREEKREVSKIKKYNKQMKQLRMEVRSSLYTKDIKGAHVHEFGPDTYNGEDDNYTHTCLICSYVETYEKM